MSHAVEMHRPPARVRPLLVALALFALFSVPAARAQDMIGQVTEFQGPAKVFLASEKSEARLTLGQTLTVGDEILTGPEARVKVLLVSGATLIVGEKARVRMAEYDGRDMRVLLSIGFLRTIVKGLFGGGTTEVETPTAVTSVRSTEWIMQARPGETEIVTIEGEVSVASVGDPSNRIELGEGQGTTVAAGAAPSPPTEWHPAKVNRFMRATSY